MSRAVVKPARRSFWAFEMAISIEFRGDVSVECAMRVVADMADLAIVFLDGGLYVTTPANAEALEKKLRQRKLEVEDRSEAAAR